MARYLNALAATGLLAAAACQTAPEPHAGFLTSYEGLDRKSGTIRASIVQRRDDAAAAAVERVFIEPSLLIGDAAPDLDEGERQAVLREVDRQICYEVSERFTVLTEAAPDAARIRAGVTRIDPTGRAGSVTSAAVNYFIPGPLGVRVPGSTGGLAVETELLAPESGRQVAALVWARNATAVGMDDPSLSRVGDALQFAEPFGDAVGDAFSPKDRKPRDIAKPDPCESFGPRFNAGGMVAGGLVGMATGLYVPELDRARPAASPVEPAAAPTEAAPEPR